MSNEFKLTDEQKKAIKLMPFNNLQIIACAGSGKTEIVSRGISEIIKTGGNPSEIVAFTFTEKAAEELKARIRLTINSEQPERVDLGDMYVGTIHSYCFEKLKELVPAYRSFDVLDEASRVAYISKPINYYSRFNLRKLEQLGKTGKLKRFTVIGRFISTVDIVLNEKVNLSKLKKLSPEVSESIASYRKALNKDRYLDFSTMIHDLVNILENDKKILNEMHRTVKYLVVDEYQDINGLQERLIKAMVGPGTRITVVGDDDQSIYGWRGAIVDYIINFESNFDRVKKANLKNNFRSTDGVISLANSYIQINQKRLTKKMLPSDSEKAKHDQQDIQYSHFVDEDSQAKFITDRMQELVGADFIYKNGKRHALTFGDMAVLIRTNTDIKRFMHYLDETRINYVVDSGETAFEKPIVVQARNFLEYVFDLNDHDLDLLVKKYNAFMKGSGYSTVSQKGVIRKLRIIRSRLDKLADRGKKDYLPDLGLQGVFHDVIQSMGLDRIDISEPDNYYLATMTQMISDYEKVWQRLRHSEFKYFNGFVQAYGRNNYAISPNTEIESVDAVKLMTIHKAKGLEFPVVFIPYLNKKRRGPGPLSFVDGSLFDAVRYRGDENDERRVYYVAMTRSEKFLFLSGMQNDPEVKKPRDPANLIGELDDSFLNKPQILKLKKSSLPPIKRNGFNFSTSFSDLSAYGRCGYDYKLRYLYGYNVGVPVAFGYGTQIHNILNMVHKKYCDNSPSDSELADLVNRQFFLRYAPGMILEPMKKAALGVIQNYVTGHSKEFENVLETEKRFEFPMGDTLITGQIDLIKKNDTTGKLKEIEIVDFKSDSSLLYKADTENQLRLYVLACIRSLGLKPQKACIHDLEKGKKRYVTIDEDKLQKTETALRQRINGIREKKFYPVSKKEICTDCDFTKLCHHKAVN